MNAVVHLHATHVDNEAIGTRAFGWDHDKWSIDELKMLKDFQNYTGKRQLLHQVFLHKDKDLIARHTTSSLMRVVAFSKATSVAVVAAFAAALDADSFNISK